MFQSIHFESKGRATTNASKPEVIAALKAIVGAENVLAQRETGCPYGDPGAGGSGWVVGR